MTANTHPDALLVTTRQAARLLGVCERTIAALIARGELPSISIARKCRRVSRADIEAYIAARRTTGATDRANPGNGVPDDASNH